MQSGPIVLQPALRHGNVYPVDKPPSRYQDVIGQFPQLKTYSHVVVLFPLADEVSQDSVVAALKTAIRKIVTKIPWLGEEVIHEGQGDGRSGTIKTAPLPQGVPSDRLLHVKDCTKLCPSYEEIIQKGGPISMFDESILCPFPGFPLGYDVSKIGFAPVVAVQANFIKGGLILNFSHQHNMMDASGMFVFLSLLVIVMQGKELPQTCVDQANIDRAKVIPLLDPGQPMGDHRHLLRSPTTPPPAPPPASPLRWAFFRLSRKALPQIKAAASNKAEFDPSVTYISSDDSICAFYWKRLAAVRVSNGSVDPAAVSKFSRAIDVRSAVGCPPGYMGQMIHHAATRLAYGVLASPDLTLSALASRLRADLSRAANEWAVRSYATFLVGVADKASLVYAGGINPALDVGCSSVSKLATTGPVEFGILGRPALIRRPNQTPVSGVMYVFPPESDSGGLPILVCLNERDLKDLREDEEWSAVTEYIG
ncbi:transferase family-domain-containing protein [Hypoxylon sp. NC1633]|nr:transferase family-domain-containing protein [Hypoxylon sp. NC1633]